MAKKTKTEKDVKRSKVAKKTQKKKQKQFKIKTGQQRRLAVTALEVYTERAATTELSVTDALYFIMNVIAIAEYDDLQNDELNEHARYKEFYFKAK